MGTATRHHLTAAREIASGLYGLTALQSRLHNLLGNGDVPEDVASDLGNDFTLSS